MRTVTVLASLFYAFIGYGAWALRTQFPIATCVAVNLIGIVFVFSSEVLLAAVHGSAFRAFRSFPIQVPAILGGISCALGVGGAAAAACGTACSWALISLSVMRERRNAGSGAASPQRK